MITSIGVLFVVKDGSNFATLYRHGLDQRWAILHSLVSMSAGEGVHVFGTDNSGCVTL